MNFEAPVAALLDSGAELVVRNGRLIVSVAFPLSNSLVNVLRQNRDRILDAWQERAAVREFDGGFTTDDAERLAWDDLRTLPVPISDPNHLISRTSTASEPDVLKAVPRAVTEI